MLGGLLGGLLGGGGGSSSFSSGGIGNSDSASQSVSNDGRVVGGEGSRNSSQIITGSNNTLSDMGAISGSLQLALAGIEGANATALKAQEASGGVLSGALTMAGEQQAKFASALENIKTSDVRVLIITGIAAVALIGVFAMRRGG